MNESLRDELLALKQRDESTRARLAESGVLFEGYSGGFEGSNIGGDKGVVVHFDVNGTRRREDIRHVKYHRIQLPDRSYLAIVYYR